MTTSELFEDTMATLIGIFGDQATATFRRYHDLTNDNTGEPLTSLLINGAKSAGASSLDLDAPGLEGTIPAGLTLTIAGDVTEYTVSADVTASSDALASVGISPVLAADAGDDVVVTIGQYLEQTLSVAMGPVNLEDWPGTSVRDGDRQLWVAAGSATWDVEEGDEVVIGSDRYRIIAPSKTHNLGGGNIRFDVLIGVR